MTFSEFGRRVAENASQGTDHGTANNIFLVGGSLKTCGVYNNPSDLQKLEDGDLLVDIDFRQVYATLLSNWMGVDSDKILLQEFDRLQFV